MRNIKQKIIKLMICLIALFLFYSIFTTQVFAAVSDYTFAQYCNRKITIDPNGGTIDFRPIVKADRAGDDVTKDSWYYGLLIGKSTKDKNNNDHTVQKWSANTITGKVDNLSKKTDYKQAMDCIGTTPYLEFYDFYKEGYSFKNITAKSTTDGLIYGAVAQKTKWGNYVWNIGSTVDGLNISESNTIFSKK